MKTNRLHLLVGIAIAIVMISCSGNNTEAKKTLEVKDVQTNAANKTVADDKTLPSSAEDGPAIATVETTDFILKIHRAIPFALKPKSYQPIKVDPATKLVVLDVSVRNKLSSPINFSRILGMIVIKGEDEGDKNLIAPWVVGAYEVDYAEPNHQKEYDALWSEHFEPNGFHRAILIGLNPKKDENKFTMIVPEKPDFNNPAKKELTFSL